jgi:hypothetical protein
VSSGSPTSSSFPHGSSILQVIWLGKSWFFRDFAGRVSDGRIDAFVRFAGVVVRQVSLIYR